MRSGSLPSDQRIGGRLGRSLALHSDTPLHEPPLVIEHRHPPIYRLCAAAELEHALMCEYLFCAFTLKRSVSPSSWEARDADRSDKALQTMAPRKRRDHARPARADTPEINPRR